MKRWVIGAGVLAALGATVGVGLDAMHVWTGTTGYAEPAFAGVAAWVPALFASAAVAIGLARPVWERVLRRRSPPPSWAVTGAGMAAFIGSYLASGLIPFPWIGIAAVLGAVFAATWAACDRSSLGLFLAAGTAVIGTFVESTLVGAGAFWYVDPDFAGVAGWLPLLYGTATIGVGNLGKRLVDDA